MKLENIKIILLDIEGTTTPIDFVRKTLFPFAKKNIGEFVSRNFREIKPEVVQLEIEYHKDCSEQLYGRDLQANSPESVINYLEFLIDADRKSTPLKSLQGKIWQQGYESGALKSEIYADVPQAFKRWKSADKMIAIYSSGSVLAQQLIFKHSNQGDLTPFISNYFDTNIGHKRGAESYRKIAASKSFPPVENFLFISDVAEELDAAATAGMQTLLSVREGNAPLREPTIHKQIVNFNEIQ